MTLGAKCQNCRFFATEIDPYLGTRGECRRRAPQVVAGFSSSRPISVFPRIEPTSWCGEFSKALPQKGADE